MLDGVPEELARPSYGFWADEEAVAELAWHLGLDLGPYSARRSRWPGLEVRDRLGAFRHAWAAAHGMIRNGRPDLEALRAAGVCTLTRPRGWPVIGLATNDKTGNDAGGFHG